MGLKPPAEVPPLTLIENPAIERSQLPSVGETIVGTPRTVHIEQVIAAAGERLPAAGEAVAEWRIGYIYAVIPGTWTADGEQVPADVAGIAEVRTEWARRFSILTAGAGLLHTDLPVAASPATNPGVTLPVTAGALAPSLSAGVAWLVEQQDPQGFWRDPSGSAVCETASAINALRTFSEAALQLQAGVAWLAEQTVTNHDFLARQIVALDGVGLENLLERQNEDGGWGHAEGYLSNPLDTSLALRALAGWGLSSGEVVAAAVAYLIEHRNQDDGWGVTAGASMVQPTAHVLLAMNAVRGHFDLDPELARGIAWLVARQNDDGGFGNSLSTIYDTAVALLAIKQTGAGSIAVEQAVTYLLEAQAESGGWQESVFQTALAIKALYAGQVQTDLLVNGEEITLAPDPVVALPADISVRARVRNQGETALTAVKVALYAGTAPNQLLQEQLVNLPGNESVVVEFPVRIKEPGDVAFGVGVDTDQIIDEASEYNNFASFTFYAGPPRPTVGFERTAASGSEAITPVELTVVLSHTWHEPVSVDFFADSAGTAVQDDDFTLEAGTLIIPPGESSASIILTIVNDQSEENSETALVRIGNPRNALLGTDLLTYTILDDDVVPDIAIVRPVDGETYYVRKPQLYYTSNMPADRISVFVDDVSVAAGNYSALGPLAYGPHQVSVAATNINGVTAIDEVTFFVDDNGLPPDLVWQKDGAGYSQFVAADDGGFYGNGSFVKFDQTWTRQWALSHTVSDFFLKDDKIYLLGKKTDGNDYLQIYEPGGKLLWEKRSPIYGGRIVVDGAGNMIVGGNLTVDMKNKPSQTDVVVYKFDPYGRHLWDHQFGGLLNEFLGDLGVDSAGNVYLYGTTTGYVDTHADGDNAGERDLFVVKIPDDPGPAQVRQLGSSLDDVASELRIDSRDNVYLAATTTGSFDGIMPTWDMEAVLIRLNDQFEVDRVIQEHMISRGVQLFVDKGDAVYLAGSYGEYRPAYQDNYTVRIIKYDNWGDRQWTLNAFDQYYNQAVRDLHVDAAGSIYIGVYYLYPNYATGYWEMRTCQRKFNTGSEKAPGPVLTLAPVAEDPWATSVTFSGTRESGASVSLANASAAEIGTMSYPTDTTWNCDVADLIEGEHRFTLSAIGHDGQRRDLEFSHQVMPPKPYRQEWLRQYGSAGDDVNTSLNLNSDGNLLVHGYTRGLWGTDLTQSNSDLLLVEAAADDGMLAEPAWQLDVDGTSNDILIDAAVDNDGHTLLLWSRDSSGHVAKFDSSGHLIWRQAIDARTSHQPKGLALDGSGGVYVCGSTSVSLLRQPFGGGTDYFVVKYDAQGTRQWLRLSGETGDVSANDIAVGPDGSLWLAGWQADQFQHHLPMVFKLDPAGLPLAAAAVAPHDGTAQALQVTADGAVYIAGSAHFMRGTDRDPFLYKLDANLSQIWQADLRQWSIDDVAALHVGAGGDVALAVNNISTFGDLYYDSQILLLNAQGQAVSRQVFATPYNDRSIGVHFADDGALYVSGWTYGALGVKRYGGSDMFLAKLTFFNGPLLMIDPYAPSTRLPSQVISGTASIGSLLETAVVAPAESTAKLSPVTVAPDGSWQFTISDLVDNAVNQFEITAENPSGTTTAAVAITVDTLPPAFLVEPVESPTGRSSQILAGTIEAGASLVVERDPPSTGEVIDVHGEAWSYAAQDLKPGDNVFRFIATDPLGNFATKDILLSYDPPPPMTLSILPQNISESEATSITLEIANFPLQAEPLLVEQIVDLNHNGSGEADEPIVRRLRVSDGLPGRNPNVSGDDDAVADGHIVTTLAHYLISDRYHAPAAYVFRISAGEDGAEAVFEVDGRATMQAISGNVLNDEGQPVTGALIELADRWGRVHGTAVSDAAGYYWMNVAKPGEYRLVPTTEGRLFDTGASVWISLVPHQIVTGADLVMGSGTHHVSGMLVDDKTDQAIEGVLVRAHNADIVTTSLTDGAGRYSLMVPEGIFGLTVNAFSGEGPSAKGYLTPLVQALAVPVDGDSAGNDIRLAAADTLIACRVVDNSGMPLAGVPLQAICTDACGVTAYATSDASGKFTLGVLSGHFWEISLLDNAAQTIGLTGTVISDIAGVDGETVHVQDLVASRIDGWVSGVISAADGQPLASIPVKILNRDLGTQAIGRTAADGRYHLGINAGDCAIEVRTEGSGFETLTPAPLLVASGQTAVRDFILTPDVTNTLAITDAVYNLRKSTLGVTATSNHPDAQLHLEDFGPMVLVRVLKGVYTWKFDGYVPEIPSVVTVTAPEGSATAEILFK